MVIVRQFLVSHFGKVKQSFYGAKNVFEFGELLSDQVKQSITQPEDFHQMAKSANPVSSDAGSSPKQVPMNWRLAQDGTKLPPRQFRVG